MSLVLVLVFALALSASAAQVQVLHFNDTYTLEPVDQGERGGMARLYTAILDLRRQSPEALVLFAGDLISPSTMSTVFRGQPMIQALNMMGVDVATFGNHEFDFGDEVLAQRIRESTFTWVVSNVINGDGERFPGTFPYVVRQVGDTWVGIMGLVTPESVTLSSPGKEWSFLDPIETARRVIPEMRDMGARVIVALTHQTVSDDVKLLESVPEIDLVVGGHEHDVIRKDVGGERIVKAGSDNRYLGVVDLDVENGRVVGTSDRMVTIDSSFAPNAAMAGMVEGWLSKLSAQMDVVIGRTSVDLDSRNTTIRAGETGLGNLVADAIREAVDADVAITNGGGIRGNSLFPAGPIRRKDVVAWLPFGNVVVKVELSGKAIRAALENGVSQVEKLAGRFPQVSGLSFAFDPARPAGERVLWVKVGGRDLDENALYVLATNDFMLKGGDGYTSFAEGRVLIDPQAGPIMADVVAAYVEELEVVAPETQARIVAQPGSGS